MKLSPDDDIYRVRMVYLGPPSYTLPVQWTYGRWALFVILSAVFVVVGLLLSGLDWRSAGFAVSAAALASAVIWRYVDQDRPARTVIRTAVTDLRAYPQPIDERVALPSLRTSHITVRETS